MFYHCLVCNVKECAPRLQFCFAVGRWPPQPSPLRDDDTSPPADCPTEITTTAEEEIPGSDAASTIINQDGERCKQTTDNESIAALPFELNQPRSTAAAGIGCAAPAYNVSVSSEDWSNPELVDDDDEDDVVVIGEVRRPAHAQCGRDETTSSGTQPTTKALLQTEKRPYKCRLCNDVFNSTTDLECHLWMHTGRKRFHWFACVFAVNAFSKQIAFKLKKRFSRFGKTRVWNMSFWCNRKSRNAFAYCMKTDQTGNILYISISQPVGNRGIFEGPWPDAIEAEYVIARLTLKRKRG